jgi:hypothetical protein
VSNMVPKASDWGDAQVRRSRGYDTIGG